MKTTRRWICGTLPGLCALAMMVRGAGGNEIKGDEIKGAATKKSSIPLVGPWLDVIEALGVSKQTGAAEKPGPKQDSKPAPMPAPQIETEPWPPETLAFAGKKAGEERSAGAGIQFCWCPAGTFVMGSPKEEKDGKFDYSSPDQVEVTLTKGFWLAKYELTQQQWERVMGTDVVQQEDIACNQKQWEADNAGHFTEWWDRNQQRWRPKRRKKGSLEPYYGQGPSVPMHFVNHLEATDFCRKLTAAAAGRAVAAWVGISLADRGAMGIRVPGGDEDGDGFWRPVQQRGSELRRTVPVQRGGQGADVGSDAARRQVRAECLGLVRHAWQCVRVVPRLVQHGVPRRDRS